MIQRLYLQCPLGHYSSSEAHGCWFDHWLQRPSLQQFEGDISNGAQSTTIARIVGEGLSADLLQHAILLDFGAEESAFDGMIPLCFAKAPVPVYAGADTWNPLFPDGFSAVDGALPVLYFRCNGGHYFCGAETCPFDGWCVDAMDDVVSAFSHALSRGVVPRPNDIVSNNVKELLPRIIIAQFGDPRRAVRGVAPMVYYHKDHAYLERDLPLAFL